MASTSNLSDPSFSSSPPCRQVFLSFRGIDTRKNFIGHLCSALEQAGIRTFKDDCDLPIGEDISVELIKAIHDSPMSIIVFSKNYASSHWCLQELVEILECKRTKGHAVFPVFYDVEPTVVRYQKDSFAEAFESHMIRYMDKVKRWKAALTEAGNLLGRHLQNDANGHEADLIKIIVKDVLPKLPSKDWNVVKFPVGIDSRLRDIYPKLSIGISDVRFIGIYGMAGIGKTTIVKDIYDRTFHQFEGSCFIENVREALKEPHGLHSLLKKLLLEVLKSKELVFTDVARGMLFLKHTLCKKKFLIVLDNMDQLGCKLIPFAGDSNWFGSGSRIIITTSDACLLDKIKLLDLSYELKKLDNNESLELFNCHAFRNSNPPTEDFMELSRRFVRYIGGLPLGLQYIGSFLFQKSIFVWKLSFEIFQIIPIDKIQKKLRISYDTLDDEKVQNIFLDIACFFIGMDKDDAVNILNDSYLSVENGIITLTGRFLLITDGTNKLGMNDLIRDMGRNIVREESIKEPGKRRRLWFHTDAYDVLKNLKGTETIEGIKLEMTMPETEHLTTTTFEKMPNLRLLQISNVHLIGSFENLFTELRWLCWHYCPLECLPSSFHPPKLVLLDMQYSRVHRLWHGAKHLKYLRILNVSHSQLLITTPDFGGLEKLEKLLLRNCSSLEQIHPSIGRLSKLAHLDLNGCFNLNKLPEQLGYVEGLKKLDASSTTIEELPDSFGHLSKLVELNLEDCRNLRILPTTICHLTSLEVLSLDSCSKLEQLPEKLGDLQYLRQLDASRTAIKQLPDSIRHLSRLVKLELEGCENLRELPSSICHLTSLEVVSLDSCSKLEKLPEKLGDLQYLRQLDASRTAIEQLPDSIGHLSRLVKLKLEGCENFRELPSSIFHLNSLEVLSLKLCSNLHLINCTSLQPLLEFPSSLKELDLTNCSSLRSLPELPPNLENLYACGCISLEKLPILSKLKHLKSLNLENCSSLQLLTDLPPNLCKLDLTGCNCLNSLQEIEIPPGLAITF